MEKLPASNYGFPCGFKKDFLAERAKIPEALFDFKYLVGHEDRRSVYMEIPRVAINSCGMCNIDMRPVSHLCLTLQNIYFIFSNSTLM